MAPQMLANRGFHCCVIFKECVGALLEGVDVRVDVIEGGRLSSHLPRVNLPILQPTTVMGAIR